MSEFARLRYTGKHPKTFIDHGIGEVDEGAEFDVPVDQAERFTRRSDIEHAGELPGLPGGDESGTGLPDAAGSEAEDVSRRRGRKSAPEAGPLTDPVASADVVEAEEG